jgi:transcriptional regulator with PAS, ATPase and Fis domain
MNVLQFECPVCENLTMADLEKMPDLKTLMNQIEKAIVQAVYEKNARNGAATARDLKVAEHVMRHLIDKHELKSEKVSPSGVG